MEEGKEAHRPEKNPHVYQPAYTTQETDEIVRWFEKRMDRLPQSLQLNEATSTTDLPRTVKSLLKVAKGHRDNISVTFSGYLAHLALIRLRLEESGMA